MEETYDAFDVVWNDAGTEEKPTEFERIPDGRHILEVMRAEIVPFTFSDKHKDKELNPRGLVMKMALSKKGHSWLWCDIPLHWTNLMTAVHQAADLAKPSKPNDIKCAEFIGKHVSVDTGYYVSKTGDKAKVDRWLTAPVETAVSKRPQETRDAKAKAQMSQDMLNDIPF